MSEIERSELEVYQSGTLPQYPVTSESIFSDGTGALKKDAVRTIREKFDTYPRLAKKVHSNGVCVAGEWNITRQTPYSGFFSPGAKGLFIGRISTAMGNTKANEKRGFGFAGKIFPTMDPNEKVKTGNFFTVDILLGSNLKHVLNARPTNEPKIGFKWDSIWTSIKIALVFMTADENPGFRPLTQVANLKLGPNEMVKQPHWFRLTADNTLKRNEKPDFRDEILTAMDNNKNLKYFIEVSDTNSDGATNDGWSTIGQINLNAAKVSYGCDRRLHFSHPTLK